MANEVGSAVFRAVADFSKIRREANSAKRALKELRDETNQTRAATAKDMQVKVEPDASNLRKKVSAEVAKASVGQKIELPMDPDSVALRKKIQLQIAKAKLGQKIEIPVEPEGGGRGGGFFRAVIRQIGGANQGAQNLRRSFSLLIIPALLTFASFLASTLGAVAAGATAVVSAMGPLVGLLGAIPGLAVGAASALAGVLLAFSGVGGALKAYKSEQKAAGKAAQGSGKTQVDTARAVATAQRQLMLAQEQQADNAVAAQRRVEDAQRELVSSQREAINAQKELNKAREEAVARLRDLQFAVDQNSISEARAVNAIEDAQAALDDVSWLGPDSEEAQRAAIDLADAELHLKEIRAQSGDDLKSLNNAKKLGVKGDEQVIQAQLNVEETSHRVEEAQFALADAQREVGRSARDSAFAVEDAAAALAEASRAQSAGSSTAAEYKRALEDLSPPARSFVKTLLSFEPLFKKLKETAAGGLFPGLEAGLKAAVQAFPEVNTGIGLITKALGGVAQKAGETIGSLDFRQKLGLIMADSAGHVSILGNAGVRLAQAFLNIAVAARPLTDWLVRLAAGWAENLAKMTEAEGATQRMTGFFAKTRAVTERLLSILGSLWQTLLNVGKAASPLGNKFLGEIDDAAKRMADFTGSVEGQSKLKQYFKDAEPVIRQVVGLVGDIIKGIGNLAKAPGAASAIKALREEVVQPLFKMLGKQDGTFVRSMIDLLGGLTSAFVAVAGTSGALKAFLQTLTIMFKIIGFLLTDIPVLSPVLRFFVVTLGVVGGALKALQFTSKTLGITALVKNVRNADSPLRKFATQLLDIGKKAAKTAKDVVRLAVANARLAAAKVVQGIKALASGFVSMGKAAVRAIVSIGRAMIANPWLLVLAAIVVAIILVVKHWDKVKAVILAVWNFIKPPLMAMWDLFKKIGIFIATVVVGYFKIWFAVVKFVMTAIATVVRTYINIVKAVITTVLRVIGAIWKGFWNGLKTGLSAIWNGIKATVQTGIDAVKSVISTVTSAIGTIWKKFWDGLKGMVGAGLQLVVDVAYKGINFVVDVINILIGGVKKILSVLPGDLDKKVHLINGGNDYAPPTIKFHEGGFVGGSGKRDVPATLQAGEFVINRGAVAKFGLDALQRINNAGRKRKKGTGDNILGDVWDETGGRAVHGARVGTGLLVNAAQETAGLALQGGQWVLKKGADVAAAVAKYGARKVYEPIRDLAVKGINGVTSHVGGFMGDLFKGVAMWPIDAIDKFLGVKDNEAAAGKNILGINVPNTAGLTPAAKAVALAVSFAIKGSRVTSGFRSAAANKKAGGAKNSLHLQGKAVDFGADPIKRLAIFKYLALAYNKLGLQELIYEHTNIKRGKAVGYAPNDHKDHVHAGVFDRGGLLNQDMVGFLHKKEMVLPPDLARGLQELVSSGGEALRPIQQTNIFPKDADPMLVSAHINRRIRKR